MNKFKKLCVLFCILIVFSAMFGCSTPSTQNNVELNSIFVDSTTHKTSYLVGEQLNIDNLSIKGQYSDNSYKNINVTKNMISGFNSNQAIEKQTLTITYQEKTTTYNISISEEQEVTLKQIQISSTNHKTIYFVGEEIDTTNLKINAIYSNGTNTNIDVKKDIITGFDSSTPTELQTLTITYLNKTTSYNISIIVQPSKLIDNIALISTNHKIQYFVGDNLDTSNLLIKITYQDSSTKDIAVTADMISGFNSTTETESQILTIIYLEKTTTFEISIKNTSLIKLEIESTNHKTNYYVNEELDLDNLRIIGTYDNGKQTVSTVSSKMVTGFDSSSINTSQTLTITYKGATVTYTISINEAPLTKLEVMSTSHKTSYYIDDILDVSNLTIKATYANKTSEIIIVTEDMVTGFDSSYATDAQTITITYCDNTTTFSIRIKSGSIYKIEVNSNSHKATYFVGEEFDTTNLFIDIYYGIFDKKNTPTPVSKDMISGFDSSSIKYSQSIKITYKDKSCTFTIGIVTTDYHVLTDVITTDNQGNPYTPPMAITTDFNYYNGSFYLLNNDFSYIIMSVTKGSGMNARIQLSGAYTVKNNIVTFTQTGGYTYNATIIDNTLVISSLVNGSTINGVKYPNYYIKQIFTQKLSTQQNINPN